MHLEIGSFLLLELIALSPEIWVWALRGHHGHRGWGWVVVLELVLLDGDPRGAGPCSSLLCLWPLVSVAPRRPQAWGRFAVGWHDRSDLARLQACPCLTRPVGKSLGLAACLGPSGLMGPRGALQNWAALPSAWLLALPWDHHPLQGADAVGILSSSLPANLLLSQLLAFPSSPRTLSGLSLPLVSSNWALTAGSGCHQGEGGLWLNA